MTKFSIVVCSRNGASTLFETLLSIIRLRKSAEIDVELIVIDNASTDNTLSIAQLFLKEYCNQMSIGVYYENNVGKSYAINLAVTRAKFNYILLCDDDNILSDDFLIESDKIINRYPSLGILGGFSDFHHHKYEIPKWFNRYQYLYAIGVQSQLNFSSLVETTNLWGAGMIFRKEIYQWLISEHFNLYTGKSQYGIYLAGEDFELCLISNILGFKNYYSSNLQFVHNINPERLNWPSTKKLVIRNSLVSIYMSFYSKFILKKDQAITKKFLNRHFVYLFFQSIINLSISSLKHVIGLFLCHGEGFSYQLVFHLSLKQLRLLFHLYFDRNYLLVDLINKRKSIFQISHV